MMLINVLLLAIDAGMVLVPGLAAPSGDTRYTTTRPFNRIYPVVETSFNLICTQYRPVPLLLDATDSPPIMRLWPP